MEDQHAKRLSRAAGLLVGPCLLACAGVPGLLIDSGAHPKGYPGEVRPLAEVGVAIGATRARPQPPKRPAAIKTRRFLWEAVLMMAIDGESWSLPEAHLLPGEHELSVRYWWMDQGDAALRQVGGLVHHLDRLREERATDRTLLLSVDAGSSYVLQVQRTPLRYFVTPYPGHDVPEPLPWIPSADAWPCTPEGDPKSERLRCEPAH